MKPHEKKVTKQEQKRSGKTKGDKKPNWKRRKSNKTLSQKSEKGQEKTLTKRQWKERTKYQDSDTWIASFHSLLSNASSLVIHQSFKHLFTDFFHVKFGRPLPLFTLPVRLITSLWIGASVDLCWTCLNYLKRCCMSFSSTGATPSLPRMSLFWTRSLVWPQIHCSMHISATLSCWICHLLVGQHSTPYNMAG
jgi:hypothetical protein